MTLTMSVEEMKQGLNLHSTPIERDQVDISRREWDFTCLSSKYS